MRQIKDRGTKPEMIVRRLAHSMGVRYRLHAKQLPGKPDLVFAARRKVIFVHGCFWHQHPDKHCRHGRMPKSRLDYWRPKLNGNAKRDREHAAALRKLGWKSLVIWECKVGSLDSLRRRMKRFLELDS
jgi:DNA mismatch endonuclease (patch repair protein)